MIVTPSGSRSTTISLLAGRCGRLGKLLASTSLSTTVFGGGRSKSGSGDSMMFISGGAGSRWDSPPDRVFGPRLSLFWDFLPNAPKTVGIPGS